MSDVSGVSGPSGGGPGPGGAGPGLRLAVFDLDGTLVDTPRAIVETFEAAFAAMRTGTGPERGPGVPGPTPGPEAIRATIGMPLERAWATLLDLPAADPRVAEGVEQYLRLFRELVLPRSRDLLFPGVVEGLDALRAAGFTLAVATSKFYASADALLTAAGLRELFAEVIGADQVTHPKPHPESGELVLARLGVPAGAAVMVGDTTHDLLMARAAGMRSVAVTYGIHSAALLAGAEPTWVAGTFDEVVDAITSAAPRPPRATAAAR
ncbi:HAD family hydrolase [Streptomyces antimicrobicus]|uniref:HAD-IA family hydrolase n=1 Tax=Streptomyces antimicrobicus TaxID=2883108 RepID=A0ABS8B2Y9_9ACTN|nr:HAD-IA family hydrolase [Streptomyces antimicrobicus]MCB5178959.1 HAD-IA family hydrolase [Streptomyces antimicrobicus]